jgi:hypothetical protein
VEEGVRKDATTLKDFHVRLERLQAQRNEYKTHDEALIRGLKMDVTSKVEVTEARSKLSSLSIVLVKKRLFELEFCFHSSFPCLAFQELRILKNESKKNSEAAQKVLLCPPRFSHLQCCPFT